MISLPADGDSHIYVDEDGCEGDGRRGREERERHDRRHDEGNGVDAAAVCNERGTVQFMVRVTLN